MTGQPRVAAACLVLMAACHVEQPSLDESTLHASLQKEPEPCNDIYCGDNGNIVGAAPFFEVDLSGHEVSSTGYRFVSATHPWGGLGPLRVDGAWPHWGPWYGPDLVGLKVQLDSVGGPVELRFERFEALSYLNGPPCHTTAGALSLTDCLPAYHIVYPVLDAGVANVPLAEFCPKSKLVDGGLQETLALVSRGDRFDRDAGTLVASGEAVGSWVNISCAGDTVSKLLFIRHAEAANAGTSVNQRKAALNMFTARYCGVGTRMYTYLGHKLAFEDYSDWAPHYEGFSTVEAIWDENGARCLSYPRWVKRNDVRCRLDPCTDAGVADWRSKGLLLSRNPVVLEVAP